MMVQSKQSFPYSLTGLNPYPWIHWWYELAAPLVSGPLEEVPLKEREFLRRGKLISIALLINLLGAFLQIGPPLQAGLYGTVLVILATIVLLVGAILLNRSKKLLAASILIISVMEFGILYTLVTPPGGLFSFAQAPFLALLIQPLIFTVLLFPAWGVFVIGAINTFVIILVVQIMPETPDLQIYMRTSASITIPAIPIATIIVCALVCFVLITSLDESLLRADKAEEINKLHVAMVEQTRRELMEKQQLETGIQEIVSGMTRFANGDLQARIWLERGHLLWSVASSINNIVGRFVRVRAQGQLMEQTLAGLQSYLADVRAAKVSGKSLPLPNTGTPLDELVGELLSYASYTQPPHLDGSHVPPSQN